MPEVGWRSLRAEAEHLLADNAFSIAGVGRERRRPQERAIRGGSVCWPEAGMGRPAGDAFMVWMDGPRVGFNVGACSWAWMRSRRSTRTTQIWRSGTARTSIVTTTGTTTGTT